MQSGHIPWKTKRDDCTGFRSQRVEAIKKRWFQNYHCRNQRGMCYRHNLDRPEVGRGARWIWKMIIMGLRIGPCTEVLGPGRPCIEIGMFKQFR
jgi:hypothetical protein